MRALKPQRGLSMIELLVTLLIGSFLVLGISQLYIDNRRSYAFQQSQSENQESSRYALLLLQQQLEKAGYRRFTDQEWTTAFPADTTLTGCNFPAGSTMVWNDTNSSLCIRYQPRTDEERDCLGNSIAGIPANPNTETTILFRERIWFDAANSRLMCASTTNAAAGELISGVAGLRFEFGVADAMESQTLDRYVAQGTITDRIVAVRYKALMRSSGGKVRDTSDDSPVLEQWQALTGVPDTAIEALSSDDTGQIYQISQSTIMLRNLMP